LSNAVYTIIGALIAGIIGILVERYRRGMEVKDRHFNEIKEECLKPILTSLEKLTRNFEFGETHPPSRLDIEELLRRSIHWWDRFSFKGSMGVNPLLYEDLPNHFKDLAKLLEDVEMSFRKVYQQFLQAVLNLSNRIKSDPEFRAFEEKFGESSMDAVFFLSLGIDKGEWPNIFQRLSECKDVLEKLGNKFYGTQEAKEVRDMQKEMLEKINLCKREVEKFYIWLN